MTSSGLSFNILQDGVYTLRPHSLSFPQVSSHDLMRFLARLGQTDSTALIAEFRAWVQQALGGQP